MCCVTLNASVVLIVSCVTVCSGLPRGTRNSTTRYPLLHTPMDWRGRLVSVRHVQLLSGEFEVLAESEAGVRPVLKCCLYTGVAFPHILHLRWCCTPEYIRQLYALLGDYLTGVRRVLRSFTSSLLQCSAVDCLPLPRTGGGCAEAQTQRVRTKTLRFGKRWNGRCAAI